MTSPTSTTGRPASFHGALPADARRPRPLHRPESHPDLQRLRSSSVSRSPSSGKLVGGAPSKLLLNVTVQGSVGPVHVVMSPESTVEELVEAAVEEYVKEGRRPLLADDDPGAFELHYSSFSLESLNPKEKLVALGSRNFFLCPKRQSGSNSSSNEATKGSKPTRSSSWLSFMGFLL